MAAPTATATVLPGTGTLTPTARQHTATVTDTGTYDPAATGRSLKINDVVVDTTVDVVSTVKFAKAGTYPVKVNVVNADGNDDTDAINVVVTDGLVASPPATFTPTGGQPRMLRKDMPREFGDGTIPTPGVPTVAKLNELDLYGTTGVVPAADGLVIIDGAPVIVDI
jgi:hypothetical protein